MTDTVELHAEPTPIVDTQGRCRLFFQEGERTPDGRIIDPNAVNFDRPPPLPIRLQTTAPEGGGHAGAVICGVIDTITRDGLTIVADGHLDLNSEAGKEAQRLIREGIMATWSPDMGDATIDHEINVLDEDTQTPQDSVAHFVKCTFLGATLVAMPALASAVVELLNDDGSTSVAAPSRSGPPADAIGVSTDPTEQKIITERTDAPAAYAVDHSHTQSPANIQKHLSDAHDLPTDEMPPTYPAMFALHEQMHDGDTGYSSDDDAYSQLLKIFEPSDFNEWASRNFPTDSRKKMAKSGVAMPDGSFPIPDKDALRRARASVGRAPASKRDAVKAHIRKRAKALGVPLTDSKIAACAGPSNPPTAFFENPKMPALQRFITIEETGHVFTHLAGWGECHIGYPNSCIEVPSSEHDYSYFRIGQVKTAEGTLISTGVLALKGGHASRGLSLEATQAHYDDTDTGIADVAIGEDEFGIWVSGAIRPDASEEDVRRLRASGVSGDWRRIGDSLELIGACSVNIPGFPKVRLISASAEIEPEVLALVAAGGQPIPDPTLEDCDCGDYESLRAELQRLTMIVTASGLEDTAFDRLAASIDD